MSMCSERYAEETPLGLPKYQLPPTSSDASKHVCGTPKSASALQAVRPLTPAPITQTDGSSPMARILRPLGERRRPQSSQRGACSSPDRLAPVSSGPLERIDRWTG